MQRSSDEICELITEKYNPVYYGAAYYEEGRNPFNTMKIKIENLLSNTTFNSISNHF